jgi:dihydrolipoamide dehydrogenase
MILKTSTTVDKLQKQANSVTATLKTKDGRTETLTVDRVILAVGIVGNVENIGLEQAGIKIDKTHVVVNPWGETGVPGIFAIGDLVGPPWLAHKAMHEGVIVAERIAGVKGVHPLDISKVPGCTYCWPQVASIGMTEAKAREGGRKIKVGKFPFIGNGKAIALGDVEGFVKTVFDAATGELLGAHMIGAEVTELIQGFAIARNLEATEAELQTTIFPHPTLSEMMHESVLAADGRPLHI